MATGTVKWFSGTKGYGFIKPDGGGHDLYVHHRDIEMDGFRYLREGERVEFEVVAADGRQHRAAVNVRLARLQPTPVQAARGDR